MSSDNLRSHMYEVAAQAVHRYCEEILEVEQLARRLYAEVEQRQIGEEECSRAVLTRLAQRICSRELYLAYQSSDPQMQNRAFANLRSYLERSLLRTSCAAKLQYYSYAREDIVQQTLEKLHLILVRKEGSAGPDDPAAFLKWTQTILIRQLHTFLEKGQRENTISLDGGTELLAEYIVDTYRKDPLEHVLLGELQQTLSDAILTMRNRRYQQVLIYTYLAGVEEQEVARWLDVPVREIYLWRHRALKALRSQPEVMQLLHAPS